MRAHTALPSLECCQVARGVPCSSGFGLRKCVAIWIGALGGYSVACGPNNFQATPVALGRQT